MPRRGKGPAGGSRDEAQDGVPPDLTPRAGDPVDPTASPGHGGAVPHWTDEVAEGGWWAVTLSRAAVESIRAATDVRTVLLSLHRCASSGLWATAPGVLTVEVETGADVPIPVHCLPLLGGEGAPTAVISVDCEGVPGSDGQLYDSQLVRVWTVLPAADALEYARASLPFAMAVWSSERARRAAATPDPRPGGGVAPLQWRDSVDAFVGRTPDVARVAGCAGSDAALARALDDVSGLSFFFTLDAALAAHCAGGGAGLSVPFRCSADELSAIAPTSDATFVVGRSGTGKTTVLLYRLLAGWASTLHPARLLAGRPLSLPFPVPPYRLREGVFRQVFASTSKLLCARVSDAFVSMRQWLSEWHLGSAAAGIVEERQDGDSSDSEGEASDGDGDLSAMTEESYPLFRPVAVLLRMVDACTANPFFRDRPAGDDAARNQEAAAVTGAAHATGDGLYTSYRAQPAQQADSVAVLHLGAEMCGYAVRSVRGAEDGGRSESMPLDIVLRSAGGDAADPSSWTVECLGATARSRYADARGLAGRVLLLEGFMGRAVREDAQLTVHAADDQEIDLGVAIVCTLAHLSERCNAVGARCVLLFPAHAPWWLVQRIASAAGRLGLRDVILLSEAVAAAGGSEADAPDMLHVHASAGTLWVTRGAQVLPAVSLPTGHGLRRSVHRFVDSLLGPILERLPHTAALDMVGTIEGMCQELVLPASSTWMDRVEVPVPRTVADAAAECGIDIAGRVPAACGSRLPAEQCGSFEGTTLSVQRRVLLSVLLDGVVTPLCRALRQECVKPGDSVLVSGDFCRSSLCSDLVAASLRDTCGARDVVVAASDAHFTGAYGAAAERDLSASIAPETELLLHTLAQTISSAENGAVRPHELVAASAGALRGRQMEPTLRCLRRHGWRGYGFTSLPRSPRRLRQEVLDECSAADTDLPPVRAVVPDAAAQKRKPANVGGSRVAFGRFKRDYWPRFPESATRAVDCAAAYAEIMSVIAGQSASPMQQHEYVADAARRGIHAHDAVWVVYTHYCRMKRDAADYDDQDVARSILASMDAGEYHGPLFDELYIDEAQDLSLLQLRVLLRLAAEPSGLLVTGDTAQTITRGCVFKFEKVKDAVWEWIREQRRKGRPAAPPAAAAAAPAAAGREREPRKGRSRKDRPTRKEPASDPAAATLGPGGDAPAHTNPAFFTAGISETRLRRNYRSHSGVLSVASVFNDVLSAWFPDTIDRMPADRGTKLGPRPTFLSCSTDQLQLELFGSRTGRMELGAEQGIICREGFEDEACSAIRHAIVLNVVDAKGLEFEDVLVYNFFRNSPARQEWRVLYGYLAANAESAVGTLPRHPPFSADRHAVLQSELKLLYVAATRARNQLWFYDEGGEGQPVVDLLCALRSEPLVRLSGPDEASGLHEYLARRSSREDWSRKGAEYFAKRKFELAASAYRKAGLSHRVRLAEAMHLRREARDASPESAAALLCRSARLFEESIERHAAAGADCDHDRLLLRAAACWEKVGEVELAARKLEPFIPQKAAQLYERMGCLEKAAELYREAGDDAAADRVGAGSIDAPPPLIEDDEDDDGPPPLDSPDDEEDGSWLSLYRRA
eukprot:TRINITY_DN1587_c0_g1_i4.p1 TRINITY_DN1587_c0_g1~~TRINITY_DN1587_c0_g1_i4.p1  ORF type:complete len:1594 (+),score=454.76 TRINITY_DN1587_c0_g1_i4:78-4859(+)